MKLNHLIAYFGHHKCGTRWILRILDQTLSELGLKWVEYHNDAMFGQHLSDAIESARVDCLCYTNAQHEYLSTLWTFRGFHVIRDPRDIVVSAYFSHLYSHPTDSWPALNRYRETLAGLTKEEGLLYEIELLSHQFGAMYTWDYSMPHVLEVKMEDLIQNPYTRFIDIMRFLGVLHGDANEGTQYGNDSKCLSGERLIEIVYCNRFARLAKGRDQGEEDVKSHYRKGAPGDWRNHFSMAHAILFEKRYGHVLRKLGYEASHDWVEQMGTGAVKQAEESERVFTRYFEALKGQLTNTQSSVLALNVQLAEGESLITSLREQFAEGESLITSLREELESRDRETAYSPEEYQSLICRIRKIVTAVVPSHTVITVVSRGDDELLHIDGYRASHMPQGDDGSYLGYYPADSDEAIARLQQVAEKGADYLVVPEPSFWWLTYYAGFHDHLEQRSRCIWSDANCLIYELVHTDSASSPKDDAAFPLVSSAPARRRYASTAPGYVETQGRWQAPTASPRPKVQLAEERDRSDNERIRLLMAAVLSPTSNCIDVGCHRGALLKDMLRFAPEGRHIAFEPIPHFYDQLKTEFPQVDVRCAALSNEGGESDFRFVVSHPGYSGLKKRAYPGEERIEMIRVRLEQLDSVLPEGYAPDLIKIDVEGGERQVIEGAIRTLTKHKPLLIFEHGRGASEYYGTRPEQIFDLLCGNAGLRLYDLDGNGPYSLQFFVRVYESGERWNFVARP